jgi:hypothetical protein
MGDPTKGGLIRPGIFLTPDSLLAGLGCELNEVGFPRSMRPHSPADWACGQPITSSIRTLSCSRRPALAPAARERSRSTLTSFSGSRTGGGRPRHRQCLGLVRPMVVQRAPCIRVVEGEASVAPLDPARSPRPICPHRTTVYQVRTSQLPRSVTYLRVRSHWVVPFCCELSFSRPD